MTAADRQRSNFYLIKLSANLRGCGSHIPESEAERKCYIIGILVIREACTAGIIRSELIVVHIKIRIGSKHIAQADAPALFAVIAKPVAACHVHDMAPAGRIAGPAAKAYIMSAK